MKTVLITGAMGYIGGHTARLFRSRGYHVIGVDWESTVPESAQFINEWIKDDFANMAPIATDIADIDYIVHCAGSSLVGPSINDPYTYFNNNVSRTNYFLNQLGSKGWQGNIVFSSSAAVYGIPAICPIPENSKLLPISPYGDSKQMCETVIRRHCEAKGFKAISLRYFNAAGCSSDSSLGHVKDDTHLIPRILTAYSHGTVFTMNGNDYATADGTCVRDYLHVEDIAEAHYRAVSYLDTCDAGFYNAYNLGTGEGFSNLDILNTAECVVGDRINYQFGSRRIGDPDALIAAVGHFNQLTGWHPTHSSI